MLQALAVWVGKAIGWVLGTALGYYLRVLRLGLALARRGEWRKAAILTVSHIVAIAIVVLVGGVIWALVIAIVAGITLDKLAAGFILERLGYPRAYSTTEALDDNAAALAIALDKKRDPRLRLANVAGLVNERHELDVLAGVLTGLGERENEPFETALIRGLAARVEAERDNFPTVRVESEAARAAFGEAIGLASEDRASFTSRGLEGLSEGGHKRWMAGLSRLLAERPWLGFPLIDVGRMPAYPSGFREDLTESERRAALLDWWRGFMDDETLILYACGTLLETASARSDAAEAAEVLVALPLDPKAVGLAFYSVSSTLLGIAWNEAGDRTQAVAAWRRSAMLPDAEREEYGDESVHDLYGLTLRVWVGVARTLEAEPKRPWREIVAEQIVVATESDTGVGV